MTTENTSDNLDLLADLFIAQDFGAEGHVPDSDLRALYSEVMNAATAAERAEIAKRLFHGVSRAELMSAVKYVLDHIDAEALVGVHDRVHVDGPRWGVDYHMGVGITIRNLLRSAEFAWSDAQLDQLWLPILNEAARRHVAVPRF